MTTVYFLWISRLPSNSEVIRPHTGGLPLPISESLEEVGYWSEAPDRWGPLPSPHLPDCPQTRVVLSAKYTHHSVLNLTTRWKHPESFASLHWQTPSSPPSTESRSIKVLYTLISKNKTSFFSETRINWFELFSLIVYFYYTLFPP